MQNKNIYILDFDGVVCDSIKECYVTSSHAYETFTGKKSKATYKKFQLMRKYVAPAGEYYVLQRILNNMNICSHYGDFLDLVKTYKKDCSSFEKIFFQERRALVKSNSDKWRSYHKFYAEVVNFLERNTTKIYIVTTKNKDAVLLLLQFANIQIDPKRVISTGDGKNAVIKKISFHHFTNNIIFIDDHPLNILSVKNNSAVKCYLATWGYWNGDTSEFSNYSFNKINLDELKYLE